MILAPRKPVEVSILFSEADKKLLRRLENGLTVLVRQRIINIRHRDAIEPGLDAAREVSRQTNTADIILLLVSASFLASDHCYSADLARALERHASGEARLIPVILRPCDWTAAEFGGVPCLPGNARPITTWSNQDEALSSIVKSLRSLILEGVEIGAEKPTQHLKREIPLLLPFLCNRIEQDEKLLGMLFAEKGSLHRPLVCIVHGNENECHDMYKSRLQHFTLPKLLHGGPSGGFSIPAIYLPFPRSMRTEEQGFLELRNNLAERVAGNRKASDAEIANTLSQFRTPVIIHCYLRTHSREGQGTDLLQSFIEYWNAFPDLPSTARVIICLFVIYAEGDSRRAHRGQTVTKKRGVGFGTRDYLNGLQFSDYDRICGGVLPEIIAIPLNDAEDYLRDDRCFQDICPHHSPSFCNIQAAVEEIRSYYKEIESRDRATLVAMQHLAKELRRVLEKNLC